MKTVTGIALLTLLLYNMLGLPVAVLCLRNDYQTAAPPTLQSVFRVVKTYAPVPPDSNMLWHSDAGLLRIEDQLYNVVGQVYDHDTLYVTMQANASAWQRFCELSELMRAVHSEKQSSDPRSRALKILRALLKVYLPVPAVLLENETEGARSRQRVRYSYLVRTLLSEVLLRHAPPPENPACKSGLN